MEEKKLQAYRFFIGKGLNPVQSAGIVGNLIHESGLKTDAINPNDAGQGKHSIGIAQWNRDRLNGLRSYASNVRGTDINDFQTQLEYVWHELNTTHKSVLKQLEETKTLSDAVHVINRHYEVSADSMGKNDPTHINARRNRLGQASALLQSQGYSHSIKPSMYTGNKSTFVKGYTPILRQGIGQQVPVDTDVPDSFWELIGIPTVDNIGLSNYAEYNYDLDEFDEDEKEGWWRDLMLAQLIENDRRQAQEVIDNPEIDMTKTDADTLSAYNSLKDETEYKEMMMALIASAQLPDIDRNHISNT